MLKTETDTPEMERRIKRAFAAASHIGNVGRKSAYAVFEHGQWWIQATNGTIYSVVDAEGRHTVDGFDFEQVGGQGSDR